MFGIMEQEHSVLSVRCTVIVHLNFILIWPMVILAMGTRGFLVACFFLCLMTNGCDTNRRYYLIQKRLPWALAIGHWEAIVWRSLKQSIVLFSYAQMPNAQDCIIWLLINVIYKISNTCFLSDLIVESCSASFSDSSSTFLKASSRWSSALETRKIDWYF